VGEKTTRGARVGGVGLENIRDEEVIAEFFGQLWASHYSHDRVRSRYNSRLRGLGSLRQSNYKDEHAIATPAI
jgi:hypothetical protein